MERNNLQINSSYGFCDFLPIGIQEAEKELSLALPTLLFGLIVVWP